MYGEALEKELNKNKLKPDYIKKFILNYYLGAALEFEMSMPD